MNSLHTRNEEATGLRGPEGWCRPPRSRPPRATSVFNRPGYTGFSLLTCGRGIFAQSLAYGFDSRGARATPPFIPTALLPCGFLPPCSLECL